MEAGIAQYVMTCKQWQFSMNNHREYRMYEQETGKSIASTLLQCGYVLETPNNAVFVGEGQRGH